LSAQEALVTTSAEAALKLRVVKARSVILRAVLETAVWFFKVASFGLVVRWFLRFLLRLVAGFGRWDRPGLRGAPLLCVVTPRSRGLSCPMISRY
jgi:hypothetical protein